MALAQPALVCLLLCLVPGGLLLKLDKFEVPSEVASLDDVELQCSYSLEAGEPEGGVFLKWFWTPLYGGTGRRQIYQRRGKQEPTIFHKNINADISFKDDATVTLSDVGPDESGSFECQVSSGLDEASRHSQLIVYSPGSGPNLNLTEIEDGEDLDEEEEVLITCEATDVSPEPDLVIKINGQIVEDAETDADPEKDGLFNVLANVTKNIELVRGAHISCELTFEDESVKHPLYMSEIDFQLEEPSSEPPPSAPGPATDVEVPRATEPDLPAEQGNGVESVASPVVLLVTIAALLLSYI